MAKIMLDPGHSGMPDPGAIGQSGTKESDINLIICGHVHNMLKDRGHEVQMTRWVNEAPETDELKSRTDASNEFGADLFLSVHCNSFSDPLANGTQSYFYRESAKGPQFAQILQRKMVGYVGLRDRGTQPAGFFVLKFTDAVAALVELAFISNADEEAILNDNQKQLAFAEAIVEGITEYLAIEAGRDSAETLE
jgi:N-acetylmuramoyl-L-alanine amidase